MINLLLVGENSFSSAISKFAFCLRLAGPNRKTGQRPTRRRSACAIAKGAEYTKGAKIKCTARARHPSALAPPPPVQPREAEGLFLKHALLTSIPHATVLDGAHPKSGRCNPAKPPLSQRERREPHPHQPSPPCPCNARVVSKRKQNTSGRGRPSQRSPNLRRRGKGRAGPAGVSSPWWPWWALAACLPASGGSLTGDSAFRLPPTGPRRRWGRRKAAAARLLLRFSGQPPPPLPFLPDFQPREGKELLNWRPGRIRAASTACASSRLLPLPGRFAHSQGRGFHEGVPKPKQEKGEKEPEPSRREPTAWAHVCWFGGGEREPRGTCLPIPRPSASRERRLRRSSAKTHSLP